MVEMLSSGDSTRFLSCRKAAKPELKDVLAADEYTVAILHATARHHEKILDQNYAFIMRIREGQIT